MVAFLARSIVVGLVVVGSVSGAIQGKRDDAVFVPKRVTIPLKYDQAGRYVLSVQMGPSTLNLTMTTSTGVTYVVGQNCTACSNTTRYDQGVSQTAVQYSNSSSVPFFDTSTPASIIKENCSITTTGAPWVYPNQTVAVVNDPSSIFSNSPPALQIGNGLSGIVGLGTNRFKSPATSGSGVYIPDFGDSVIGQWLATHPTALNFTFGVALDKPVDIPAGNDTSSVSGGFGLALMPESAGRVDWLQPDSSSYQETTLKWAQVNNPSANLTTDPQVNDTVVSQVPATPTPEWEIPMDGWAFNIGKDAITNRDGVSVSVDPLYPGIYVPIDKATLIHAAIPNAVIRSRSAVFGQVSQSWTVPCDASFTFTLVIASQTYPIGRDILVIPNGDGTCRSGIEAWTEANVNQYLLGARFMSAVYVIFTVPQDGVASIGLALRRVQQKNAKRVAPIVAGVFGTLLGLSALALVGYFGFYRPRLQKRQHEKWDHNLFGNEEDRSRGQVVTYPLLLSDESRQAYEDALMVPASATSATSFDTRASAGNVIFASPPVSAGLPSINPLSPPASANRTSWHGGSHSGSGGRGGSVSDSSAAGGPSNFMMQDTDMLMGMLPPAYEDHRSDPMTASGGGMVTKTPRRPQS